MVAGQDDDQGLVHDLLLADDDLGHLLPFLHGSPRLSTAPRKKGADLSGVFARMTRYAQSPAGSARPPPSRKHPLWGPRGKGTVPAGKSARSNVFLQILVLSQ